MLRDITLGQYFPGDTLIHRLDPRTKILVVILYIIALFVSTSYITYGIMAAILIAEVAIARIKPSTLLKSVRPILFIIILTVVLNAFYTPGEPIFSVWIFTLTREGLRTALFMAARLILLVMSSFMLTYTTSPIMLTDGLESLLSPLKKLGAPVHELAMMMSIALRFIPTLIEETQKIMSAQKARGAEFDTGGIIDKAKALLPILVPLFISSFRRADELAVAMEARCYHGGEGRTKLHELRFKGIDYAALAIMALALAAVIVLRNVGAVGIGGIDS
ncbi:MAG: energy-coupling factor transporter transmembrane protein EcfT [Oscillospiraceae bacterium]|nr:energy-coupling factor transporter transmembrane protein EcfT [Oscillospiraceae bacterium]